MAHRRSTALRKAIASQMPYSVGMGNFVIEEYSGSQPSSADKAPTGTLLNTYTLDGNAVTDEVRATAVIVFSSDIGTPAVSALTAGGGIPLIDSTVTSDGTIADLADDLADAINAKQQIPFFTAVSDGVDTVTISAPIGMGADANGLTLAITAADVTATINGGSSSAFGGTGATAGVDNVNGLDFNYPDVSGVLSKSGSSSWKGTAVATGTAGWARLKMDPADDDSESTLYRRVDLSVATSGGELTVGTTSRVSGNSYSIDEADFTVPGA